MHIAEIADAPIQKARFVKNPCCTGCALDELDAGGGLVSYYQVVRSITLAPSAYEEFAQDLKKQHIFLDGMGGYASTDPRNPLEFTTPEELMEWEDGMFREIVSVKSQGYPTLLIDAQMKGYTVWLSALSESGN